MKLIWLTDSHNYVFLGLWLLWIMNKPMKAIVENMAPVKNASDDPYRDHNTPAIMLEKSIAIPQTKLNTPYAVPRNSWGVVSVTMVASNP